MPDYKNGKIYRLTCDDPSLVYYGSTTSLYLSNRLSGHHQDFKKDKPGTTSKELFAVGGVKIHLCEAYPCETKQELLQRERWWIENNNCVNNVRPIASQEERQERRKEYRAENSEEIKQKKREHHHQNKERLNEVSRRYYYEHREDRIEKTKANYEKKKEEKKAYAREYYKRNKERQSELARQRYQRKKEANELTASKII